jgi:glycosyltransferase involved in cell wall biosynthesis
VSRLCLYYRVEPERDRWLPGDRFVRPAVRRLVRGRPRRGGVEKVFHNLCLGLERLGVPYSVNLPFQDLRSDDHVGMLGRGRYSLEGYNRPNPVVAGIGLMSHPAEWPSLLQDYPVMKYLQHSQWTNDLYKRFYGDRCAIWPVGIDIETWKPVEIEKDIDFLLYDKVFWDRPRREMELFKPVRAALSARNRSFEELRYGEYEEEEFRRLLARSKAMIFLSEHESQGLAYQECLSFGVPVLAWDQGWWQDPNRFRWGTPDVPATSVPYFDARCGETFRDATEYLAKLDGFLHRLERRDFRPRDYMLENLTLEGCARKFLAFFGADAKGI